MNQGKTPPIALIWRLPVFKTESESITKKTQKEKKRKQV